MIVTIKVQDKDGKFINRSAQIGEFAEAVLNTIIDDGKDGGRADGWWWMRQWLGMVCIRRAEKNSGSPQTADIWYARYQAIRDIK